MCHGFQDFRSYYYIFSSFFVHFANKLLLPPPARQQFPCQFGQIFLYFGSLQQISVQNRDVHLVSFFYAFSREGQECPDLFSRFYWDILSFLPFRSMSLVMVFRHVSAPSPLPAMATCHGPGGRRSALGQFSPLPPSPPAPAPPFSSGPAPPLLLRSRTHQAIARSLCPFYQKFRLFFEENVMSHVIPFRSRFVVSFRYQWPALPLRGASDKGREGTIP